MDLFTQHLSKKDQLLAWIQEKGHARTSDVVKWGSANFSGRAERNARQLAEEGKIRRMDDSEKARYGYGRSKEEIWICDLFLDLRE